MHYLKHALPQACITSSMHYLKHALPQACITSSILKVLKGMATDSFMGHYRSTITTPKTDHGSG
jgi:hypothetical protein